MFFHDILHLHKRDHFAAYLHKSFEPSYMPKISVLINESHIAGIIPSVDDAFCGEFRIAQVSLHHQVPFYHDFTHFPGLTFLSGLQVFDAYLHIGNYLSYASRPVEFRRIG